MDIGVLTVVAAGVCMLALIAWFRVVSRYDDRDGRGFRMVAAIVVSLLAITAGAFELGHVERQRLATDALAVVSDVEGASVNCERLSEELFNARQFQGYVYYDGSHVAHLRRTVCHDLWDYAHGNQSHPTDGQVIAVHIVAHEAQHINGVTSEGQAECLAVQLNHLVAETLGATPDEARELQRRYYADFYPHQPSEYVSSNCAAGSDLDIFADRVEFP